MNSEDKFLNKVINGDCMEEMKKMPNNSIDTIITDPPYNLSTVERFKAKDSGEKWNVKSGVFHRTSKGFMGKEWDGTGLPFKKELWEEALRIAKPGATLLCFGGTRTYHRLACAIEDAGFEIFDTIFWCHGSGFPKSLNIGQALDKSACRKQLEEQLGRKPTREEFKKEWEGFRKVIGKYELPDVADGKRKKGWKCTNTTEVGIFGVSGQQNITLPIAPEAQLWDGWGTGLKPAVEPIICARKPCEGPYAENALKYGVAGLNIDGGRINYPTGKPESGWSKSGADGSKGYQGTDTFKIRKMSAEEIQKNVAQGRFPANLLMSCECDEVREGKANSSGGTGKISTKSSVNTGGGNKYFNYADKNGKEKSIIHTNPECPCYMLNRQSGISKSTPKRIDRTIGASRFFKQIKLDKYCFLCYNTYTKIINKESELWRTLYVKNVEKSLESKIGIKNNDIVLPDVPPQQPQEKEDRNQKKNILALNVGKNFGNINPIQWSIVQLLAMPRANEKLVQNVKDAGNLCDLCGISIAHALVEIKNLDFQEQELIVILDYIPDYKKYILIQNLVSFAELWENTDTIPTIQSLSLLFGSVQNAIKNFMPQNECVQKRFLYQPKASRAERNMGCERLEEKIDCDRNPELDSADVPMNRSNNPKQNNHPTVKPLKLMEYLCKLTKTPTGGIVLDPFAGSGTTGMACKKTGRDFILIEKEKEYCEIANARLASVVYNKELELTGT